MALIQEVEARVIDHYGLVAALIDKLGLVKKINSLLPKNSKPHNLTHGQVVKALIMAGLGFYRRPLYLMKDFFRGKPVDLLIGPGITGDMFTDSVCGRTLDAIYAYGVENFFYSLISLIDRDFDIFNKFIKLDTTSFLFHGKYKHGKSGTGKLARGHSKDNRPDLFQLILSLGMSGKDSLPLMMGIHSGNEADKNILPQMALKVKKLKEALSWRDDIIVVADSALYSEKFVTNNLFKNTWVTRVPEGIKKSRKILEENYEDITWEKYGDLQYSVDIVEQFGVLQRWIIVYSPKAYHKEVATLHNNIKKEEESILKKIKKVNKRIFHNKYDANNEFYKLG